MEQLTARYDRLREASGRGDEAEVARALLRDFISKRRTEVETAAHRLTSWMGSLMHGHKTTASDADAAAAATKVQAAMRGKSVRSAREKKSKKAVTLAVTPQRFALGCDVYVKRSNGEECIAFVKEYDAVKKAYTVELEQAGSGKTKQCREDIMREGPSAEA